jgi:RES domain-containing protein
VKRYAGLLYRALNPVWAREPLSGRGAELYGGRFNPKGVPALYASRSPVTALREANQVGTLQPTTLVAYEADLRPVFDTRDEAALLAFRMTPELMAAPTWREEMARSGESRTQEFARQLIGEGFAAMIVRSFARGANGNAVNVVVWSWSSELPAQLVVVDDENRLGRAE